MQSRTIGSVALVAFLVLPSPASAQSGSELSRHFGFGALRVVVVDDGCGPEAIADLNGDGRPDLAVVNNRKSRIEINYLRAAERTDSEMTRRARVNDLPPNPWYDRKDISVRHRVGSLSVTDFDGDGRPDLVYTGTNPSELVVLAQEKSGVFTERFRRRVPDLPGRAPVEIADVVGNDRPELLTLVGGNVTSFPIDRERGFGEPTKLTTEGDVAGLFVEDFDGDGLTDVMAVSPEAATPVRIWLQHQDPTRDIKSGLLATERRFEMPQLREAEPVRFPGRAAASIGVIERASRRIVIYDLVERETAPEGSERIALAEVRPFPAGSSRDRSLAIADLDLDGNVDLIATDAKANTMTVFRQSDSIGFGRAEAFSAFKQPKSVAVGQWDGGGSPEVFVLSEEEKVVGISSYDAKRGRLSFPVPVSLVTAGGEPVSATFVDLDGVPTLAIVVKKRRDYWLELHAAPSAGTEPLVLELEDVSRAPQAVIAADADQDGRMDLLLLNPNESMIMVRSGEKDPAGRPSEIKAADEMAQFGLVEAAGGGNTALIDIDGDGREELLIADDNFVRACRYDTEHGWIVVDQITIGEQGAKLSGLAVLSSDVAGRLVASDPGLSRLLVIGPDEDGAWGVRDRVRVEGFALTSIRAGRFTGDDTASVMCVGDDGFAIVRLAGREPMLETVEIYRAEEEDRVEHELEVGDVNGDGYTDIVVLDAGEQMCSILTFSATRKLYLAMEFEVFQTRLFSGGSSREFEPRNVTVADADGDGRDDLVMTVHDRLMVYPQETTGN